MGWRLTQRTGLVCAGLPSYAMVGSISHEQINLVRTIWSACLYQMVFISGWDWTRARIINRNIHISLFCILQWWIDSTSIQSSTFQVFCRALNFCMLWVLLWLFTVKFCLFCVYSPNHYKIFYNCPKMFYFISS